jgi:hypothetical protein
MYTINELGNTHTCTRETITNQGNKHIYHLQKFLKEKRQKGCTKHKKHIDSVMLQGHRSHWKVLPMPSENIKINKVVLDYNNKYKILKYS